MSEYYYVAVPKLKAVFFLGSRSSIGDTENVEEIYEEIEKAVEYFIELSEKVEGSEEPVNEKNYRKMTLSDIGELIKTYERAAYTDFDKMYVYVVLAFLKRYGLEYEIYSEYDEETAKKYESYQLIDIP